MDWSYSYSSSLWPSFAAAVIVIALTGYSWRRRSVPGAKPFAIGCLLATAWAVGSVLEISAVDPSVKIFWFKFQSVCQLPMFTALSCFVMVYSGFGRWLTRRNLLLLAVPPLLFLAMVLTNESYHLLWDGFLTGDHIRPIFGSVYWVPLGYGYALGLINMVALIWLAIRSPQHRQPSIIMLFGQTIGLGIYLVRIVNTDFTLTAEFLFISFLFPFSMYALALYRFHLFDPVTAARKSVIEQMSEGMLVLDLQGRIIDWNPAAARILDEPANGLYGRAAAEVLPAIRELLSSPDKTDNMPFEISLGNDRNIRYYSLNITSLRDNRGQRMGQMVLLHDVTEQKRSQAQLLEQQHVVATLQERERLARELHDGVGQVMGYVSLQAQSVYKWVDTGNTEKAKSLLSRLIETAQRAHADVRESILSLKAGSALDWAFLPTLRQYLADFRSQYDINTDLVIQDGLKEGTLEPAAEVQLLRVIQEALNNTRKHSRARTVRVSIQQVVDRACITVTDDGCGFDPGQLVQDPGRHFGLAFMRERMMQIGGSMKLESHTGRGTVVHLEVPVREQQEKME